MKLSFPAVVAILVVAAFLMSGAASMLTYGDEPSSLKTFRSKNDLMNFLNTHRPNDGGGVPLFGPVLSDAENAAAPARDHSKTNTQVAGVDEGDIVKTDGEHIFISDGTAVHIIRADPSGALSNVSTIRPADPSSWCQISDLYLDNGTLVVVYSCSEQNVSPGPAYDAIYLPVEQRTVVAAYDVSDASDPHLAYQAGVDGWPVSTRMVGGTVYAVVQHYIWDRGAPDLPEVQDGNGSAEVKSSEVLYDPSVPEVSSFVNLLAVDVRGHGCDCLTVLSGTSSVVYMSPFSLYITMEKWPTTWMSSERTGDITTTVYRIAVDGLDMELAAQGEVDGRPINQFALDEKDGLLRIATTSWMTQNNTVSVLDRDLQEIGRLSGIAPGETIYSCRFLGDLLYLVTFLQVDPLFIIDLSQPSEPAVLGELKVPGVSTYLQMTEHGLLGIGFENGSLKVSLFDVTDPSFPREIDTYTAPGHSYSEAQWNHHAVLYDERHGLLSLPVSGWEHAAEGSYWSYRAWSATAVLSVSSDGLELRGTIEHQNASMLRSLYIDDLLYTVSTTTVKVNRLPDLGPVSSLVYREEDPYRYAYVGMEK